MDLLDRFFAQLNTVQSVWMPFIVALAVMALALWKAMDWRYNGIIERHKTDVEYLEKALARSAAPLPKQPPLPAMSGPIRQPWPEEHVAERIFLPSHATIEKIAGIREVTTGAQADKILNAYIGKWIKIEGEVDRTGYDRLAAAYVHLKPDMSKPAKQWLTEQVTLWFSDNFDRVERLEPGTLIRAQGQIDNITDLGFIIIRSEFLD